MRLSEMDVDKDGQYFESGHFVNNMDGCFVDCFSHEEDKEGLGEYAKLPLRQLAQYDGRPCNACTCNSSSAVRGSSHLQILIFSVPSTMIN